MVRGGKRKGAGRPVKPESEKTKKYTFALYPEEKQKVKTFVKSIREKAINLKEIL